jgi:hypothetical protein
MPLNNQIAAEKVAVQAAEQAFLGSAETFFRGPHNPDTWQMRNPGPAHLLRSRPCATKQGTTAQK